MAVRRRGCTIVWDSRFNWPRSVWQNIRAEQLVTGQATDYSSETATKGGHVGVWHSWYEVVRVNKKTVSLIVDRFSSRKLHTLTYPYAKSNDYRAPTETTDTK